MHVLLIEERPVVEAEAKTVPQGIGADIIPVIVSPLLRGVWPFRHDIHISGPVVPSR